MTPHPITQPDAGATIHLFTTCRVCLRLRRALKEPEFVCSECEAASVAAIRAAARRDSDAWVRELVVSLLIVGAFVALMAFANAVRPWL